MSRFYTDDGPVYEYPQVNDFIDYVIQDGDLPTCTKRKGGKVYKLINCPCAFDIETTSLLQNDDKYGFMYIWMFGINGISIYGCRVVETKDGDFIGLPQRKGNDGKWYSIVWAKFSEADTEDILAEVEKQLNS